MTNFGFNEITFDGKDAVVRFNIDFWAKIKKTNTKISFSGVGKITFKQQNGYWYLIEVNLPIVN